MSTSHLKPRRPPRVAACQELLRWFFRLLFLLVFRVRVHGVQNFPTDQPVLICANHQSSLDPLVVGVVVPSPINYLAKKSLFRWKPLARVLTYNDTIAIDRDSLGLDGLKETLRRLKRREAVLMFPEGTRSPDGHLQPFKPGLTLLARRSRAVLLPLAMEGCFQAFPRTARFPRWGTLDAVIGAPIEYEQYQHLSEADTVALVEGRLNACFEEARRRRNRR